jgi:hypothetical protein
LALVRRQLAVLTIDALCFHVEDTAPVLGPGSIGNDNLKNICLHYVWCPTELGLVGIADEMPEHGSAIVIDSAKPA